MSATLTGCVKWFDNSLNYGFITVLSEGEHHNADIFVHQSNIKTKRDCFRTLYTGECVQFELAKSDNEKHPFHAVGVSGFNNSPLHCENPSFRGNGRGRGGSNRGRGGRFQSRRETTTDTKNSTSAPVEVADEPAAAPAPAETSAPATPAPEASATPQQTAAPSKPTRGRGRGRGPTAV